MKDIRQEDWYKDLKVKGMVDYAGHYVEMKEVDKNQKVWWHWSDGAITNEGFRRDKLFNTLYFFVKHYRRHKFLVKLFAVVVIAIVLYLIIF